jgi:hypothetical protein
MTNYDGRGELYKPSQLKLPIFFIALAVIFLVSVFQFAEKWG